MADTQRSTLQELLIRAAEIVPEEELATPLSQEERDRLLKIAAWHQVQQAQEVERLRAASAQPVAVDARVLDPSAWGTLFANPLSLFHAESWIRMWAARALEARTGAKQTDAMISALVSLMAVASRQQALLADNDFLKSARILVAEIAVAREIALGMKPPAAQSIRSSLREEKMPDALRAAYEHARTIEKLSTPSFPSRGGAGKKKWKRRGGEKKTSDSE